MKYFEKVTNPKVHNIAYYEKPIPKNFITDYNKHKTLEKGTIPVGSLIIKNIYSPSELKRVEKKVHCWFMNKDIKTKKKFDNFHGNIIKFYDCSWDDFISKLCITDKSMNDIIITHMDRLLLLLGTKKKDKKRMLENSEITFIKYKNKTGLRHHQDNPKNKGPTLTLSLNSKYSPLDFIPFAELNHKKAIRIYVPRGNLLIIDGDSRFGYKHGMPFNYDYGNEYRYSITVRFHPLPSYIDTKKNCSKKIENSCWNFLPRLQYNQKI
jgi:hypothetical protein